MKTFTFIFLDFNSSFFQNVFHFNIRVTKLLDVFEISKKIKWFQKLVQGIKKVLLLLGISNNWNIAVILKRQEFSTIGNIKFDVSVQVNFALVSYLLSLFLILIVLKFIFSLQKRKNFICFFSPDLMLAIWFLIKLYLIL